MFSRFHQVPHRSGTDAVADAYEDAATDSHAGAYQRAHGHGYQYACAHANAGAAHVNAGAAGSYQEPPPSTPT